jgi:hypothetical protein
MVQFARFAELVQIITNCSPTEAFQAETRGAPVKRRGTCSCWLAVVLWPRPSTAPVRSTLAPKAQLSRSSCNESTLVGRHHRVVGRRGLTLFRPVHDAHLHFTAHREICDSTQDRQRGPGPRSLKKVRFLATSIGCRRDRTGKVEGFSKLARALETSQGRSVSPLRTCSMRAGPHGYWSRVLPRETERTLGVTPNTRRLSYRVFPRSDLRRS